MTKTSRILVIAAVAVGRRPFGGRSAERHRLRRASVSSTSTLARNRRHAASRRARRFRCSGRRPPISSSQPIHNGAIFDIIGGYRVWHGLAVAVGYSRFGRTSDGSVVAMIPDPLVFDRPKTVTTTQTGLAHSENGIHLQAVWFIPITTRSTSRCRSVPRSSRSRRSWSPGSRSRQARKTLSLAVGSEEGDREGRQRRGRRQLPLHEKLRRGPLPPIRRRLGRPAERSRSQRGRISDRSGRARSLLDTLRPLPGTHENRAACETPLSACRGAPARGSAASFDAGRSAIPGGASGPAREGLQHDDPALMQGDLVGLPGPLEDLANRRHDRALPWPPAACCLERVAEPQLELVDAHRFPQRDEGAAVGQGRQPDSRECGSSRAPA